MVETKVCGQAGWGQLILCQIFSVEQYYSTIIECIRGVSWLESTAINSLTCFTSRILSSGLSFIFLSRPVVSNNDKSYNYVINEFKFSWWKYIIRKRFLFQFKGQRSGILNWFWNWFSVAIADTLLSQVAKCNLKI